MDSRLPTWLLSLLLLAGCATTPTPTSPVASEPTVASVSGLSPAQQLQSIVGGIAGEWDNYQEVWSAQQDPARQQQVPPRMHYSIQPLSAEKIGRQVFLVQQTGPHPAAETAPAPRLRVWRFAYDNDAERVRQDVYAFRQADRYLALINAGQQAQLRHQDLLPTPGCSLWWSADVDGSWLASVSGNDCTIERQGGAPEFFVRDQLRLRGDSLELDSSMGKIGQPAAPPMQLQLRRAQRFEGWLAINAAGPNARAGDAQRPWHTRKDLRLHDGGQRVEILWDDGSASGWSVQLARLKYDNAPLPILRMDLLEDKSGRVYTYVWSGAESSQIGMNLGWFQVGLSKLAE